MIITDNAGENLRRFPVDVQKRIFLKLVFYSHVRDPLAFAQRIHDHPLGSYRFRIGDYRALFDVADGEIYILAIGHRKDIYD